MPLAVTMPTTMVAVAPVAVIAVSSTVSVPPLIFGHVDVVVPLILDEIDGTATGIVLVAMLVPVFCMPGGNIDVDRRRHLHSRGYMSNDDGSWVDHLRRREVANIDAAIKSRLTDADGHADIGRLSRRSEEQYGDNNKKMFHDPPPELV